MILLRHHTSAGEGGAGHAVEVAYWSVVQRVNSEVAHMTFDVSAVESCDVV
jgi:hypothetical protein